MTVGMTQHGREAKGVVVFVKGVVETHNVIVDAIVNPVKLPIVGPSVFCAKRVRKFCGVDEVLRSVTTNIGESAGCVMVTSRGLCRVGLRMRRDVPARMRPTFGDSGVPNSDVLLVGDRGSG
jgi:hypothetical protein